MFRIRLPTTLKKPRPKSENETLSPTKGVGGGSLEAGAADDQADFRPFTKESTDKFDKKTVRIARECGYSRKGKSTVDDESVLPGKYEPFPRNLYGRPLEEIDSFIYEEVGPF